MSATISEPQAPAETPDPQPPKAGVGRILLGIALYVMWDGHGNLWPLVFVAFVPMLVAAYRLLPRRLTALPYAFAAFGYWLSMAVDGGGVLPISLTIAIAMILALVWLGLGIFEKRFSERTNYKWFIIQLPLLWVGLEVIFQGNLVLGSNFWIAYRTSSIPSLIQPVSIVSTPAWSFLIVMINSVIALLVLKWIDGRWPQLAAVKIPSKNVKWSAIITVGTLVIWIAVSLLIYANVNSQLGPKVRVAAVQTGIQNTTSSGELGGGGDQNTPEDNARNAKLQAQLTRMTTRAAAEGAQLVVWPEEELDYDVTRGDRGKWIGELAKATNTTIVAGYMPKSPDSTSPNLAGVWLPSGAMERQTYAKVHPVIVEGEAFTPGTISPIYQTSFGNLGVIICFDHDFPDSSPRTSVAAGADIVAVPAIDPYSIVNLRYQSLTFRAIENRVPFVKTDVGFDSAIVNANGVVQDRVAIADPDGKPVLLVTDVNIGPRGAPFTQMGGYPFTTLIVLGLFVRYIWQFILRRRSRRSEASTSEV